MSPITFLIVFGLCFSQVVICAIGVVMGWHFHAKREAFEKFEEELRSAKITDVIGKHRAPVPAQK